MPKRQSGSNVPSKSDVLEAEGGIGTRVRRIDHATGVITTLPPYTRCAAVLAFRRRASTRVGLANHRRVAG